MYVWCHTTDRNFIQGVYLSHAHLRKVGQSFDQDKAIKQSDPDQDKAVTDEELMTE